MENSNRLKELRKKAGLTYDQAGNYLGYKGGTYYRKLENGERPIKMVHVKKLAELYNVSMAYLMGEDDRLEIFPANVVPVNRENIIMLPIIGNIAAGIPIYAMQEEDNFMPFDVGLAHVQNRDVSDYFYLRVKGNSMEPNLMDGDVALVRKQSIVDNGEIVAVIVDSENATCKRITIADDKVILNSDNPSFKPMVYKFSDCRIIGKIMGHYRED